MSSEPDLRSIRARFKGSCYACRRPIAVGERILYDPATRQVFCAPSCEEQEASVRPDRPKPTIVPEPRLLGEPTAPPSEPDRPEPTAVDEDAADVVAPPSVPASSAPVAIGLAELVGRLRGAVDREFPSQLWVRAEIITIEHKPSKFVRLELADTGEHRAVSAETRAVITPRDADRVLGRFKKATGTDLAKGMTVLLAVSVSFGKFGLELEICDVDPNYSAGAQLLAARECVERLTREGLVERNSALAPPLDFTRVAVIAPEGAHGLDDFRAEADRLADAGLCEFAYVHASFSGEHARATLVDALARVAGAHETLPFDAVVLLRGGGGSADLLALNDYEVARAVCKHPAPVFTAIGHERDRTVLDVVANRAFGTPSKVATAIAARIVENAERARRAVHDIRRLAERAVTQERKAVDDRLAEIEALAREQRARASEASALLAAEAARAARGVPLGVALPVLVAAFVAIGLAAAGRPGLALVAGVAGAAMAYWRYRHTKRGER